MSNGREEESQAENNEVQHTPLGCWVGIFGAIGAAYVLYGVLHGWIPIDWLFRGSPHDIQHTPEYQRARQEYKRVFENP